MALRGARSPINSEVPHANEDLLDGSGRARADRPRRRRGAGSFVFLMGGHPSAPCFISGPEHCVTVPLYFRGTFLFLFVYSCRCVCVALVGSSRR